MSNAASSVRRVAKDIEKVPMEVARESVKKVATYARTKRGSKFMHGRYALEVRGKAVKQSNGALGVVNGGRTRGFWAIKTFGQSRSYAGFANNRGDRRWTMVREYAEDEAPRIAVRAVRGAVG